MHSHIWHKTRLPAVAVICLLAGPLLLAGWRGVPDSGARTVPLSPASSRQGRGDTLHIGIVFSGGFLPIPPEMMPDIPEKWIMEQVYGPGLIMPRRNGIEELEIDDPTGVLSITKPEPAAEPGKYYFTLRRGVQFHDGRELDLRDIEASFDTYKRLALSKHHYVDYAFTHFNSVTMSPDENKVGLSMPEWLLPTHIKNQIYRLAASAPLADRFQISSSLAPQPEIENQALQEPVGLGAYVYDGLGDGRRTRASIIRLKAFEDYFGEGPYIRNIAIHLYPNDRELIQAFLTGEIQLVRLPTFHAWTSLVSQLKGRYIARSYRHPNHFFFLAFNNQIELLNNKDVRRALSLAIKRTDLDFRDAPPAWSAVTNLPFHPRSELGKREKPRYQPRGALRILRESAQVRMTGSGTGYPRNAEGERFELELIYPNHVGHYETMARSIKNDLENLEFVIRVTPLPPVELRKRLEDGDYQLALSEMTLPPTPESLDRLYNSSNTANGLNFTRYQNRTFDSLINAVFREDTPNKQRHLTDAINLINEEIPLLPLFFQDNEYYVFDSRVLAHESIGQPGARLAPMASWRWR